jgi:hypothetical protein
MAELIFVLVIVFAVGGWKAFNFLFHLLAPNTPVQKYTKGRVYPVYGAALLILLAAAEFWGLGFLDSDKIKNVPKNVRENPGVYRSHYRSYGQTYRGK